MSSNKYINGSIHFKTTYFLLLAVCVTVCLIMIMEREPVNQDTEPDRTVKLIDFKPEEITYLAFSRDGNFIECSNEQGQWFIRKPIIARADQSKINRILAVLEMLPKQETIGAAERQSRELSLADYGLSKPRARVVLGKMAQRHSLNIGNYSPLHDSLYVQLDTNETAIVTSTNLLAVIPLNANEIRDIHLLSEIPADIIRVEIKRQGGPLIQLTREGAQWVIRKPVLAHADWSRISALLDNLRNMTVQRFVSETMADPIAYGLGKEDALLQISLWRDETKPPQTIIFGKNADEKRNLVYANCRGESTVYAVKQELVEALHASVENLREHRLFFMLPEEITLIRLEQGEKVLQLRSEQENLWQIDEPKQWKADNKAIAELIGRFTNLRIEKQLDRTVTNLSALGLDPPRRIIRVANVPPATGVATQFINGAIQAAEDRGRTLRLSNPQPGSEYIFVKFEDEPHVYVISASAAAGFSLDPITYRTTTVLALKADTVRGITLKRNGKEQLVERNSSESWSPVRPDSGEVDLDAVNNLLAHITDLVALRFESSEIKNISAYGLQHPQFSLTFHLIGEAGLQKTLIIGERTEDLGIYAMVQGQDIVFVLDRALVDLLGRDILH